MPESSLFLRVFLSSDEGVLSEILKSIFNFMPTVHHILTVTDKEINPKLQEAFNPCETSETLVVAHRDKYVPELFIRQAKVEDNDDIRHTGSNKLTI